MSQSKVRSETNEVEENDPNFKAPKEVSDNLHVNGTGTKEEHVAVAPDSPKAKIHTRRRSKTPNITSPSPELKDLSDTTLNRDSPKHPHNTRSRSRTPQNKTPPEGKTKEFVEPIPEETQTEPKNIKENVPDIIDIRSADVVSIADKDEVISEKDEEIMPELEFDENDIDVESEGSPDRCKTRRSNTTHVSTPKTPKVVEDEEFVTIDMIEVPDLDASDTQSSASIDNISITAVAGSDITRNDLVQDSVSVNEYTYTSPDRSLSLKDSLRNISPRRTIRSVNAENYRKYALQHNRQKNNEVESPIPCNDLLDRIAGVKHKSSSIEFNEPKKFKSGSGLLSYITLPIYNFKDSFTTRDEPKLDEKESVVDNEVTRGMLNTEEKVERKWCSIM